MPSPVLLPLPDDSEPLSPVVPSLEPPSEPPVDELEAAALVPVPSSWPPVVVSAPVVVPTAPVVVPLVVAGTP